MSDSAKPEAPLVKVGRYARLATAREHGLVAAAKEIPHWIQRDGEEWVLLAEAPALETVLQELGAFDTEENARPPAPPTRPAEKLETFSLYVAAWLMSFTFLVQKMAGERWMDRGEAVSEAIVKRGEWWRTLTALTLHGDVMHISANIASGLIFAAFTISHFGTGLAWLGIVLSGALGNAINAWGYRGEMHASIGASTAVFGAMGMLVGGEFVSRLSSPITRTRWQLILPIGAGLALLAFLGAGGDDHKNIDFMAHLWGFVAGLPMGGLGVWLRVKERTPRWAQRVAALLAVALPALAWWRAWR